MGRYLSLSRLGAAYADYEFKCKPGLVTRRPCLISPFHYRLDWLAWFAAFQNYQHASWIVHLSARLLRGRGDDGNPPPLASSSSSPASASASDDARRRAARRYQVVRDLIALDPFLDAGEPPPTFLRVQHYRYRYETQQPGVWWRREELGTYLPPINLENPSLQQFLEGHGWSV